MEALKTEELNFEVVLLLEDSMECTFHTNLISFFISGNPNRCQKNGAFGCKSGECIYRFQTCTGIKICQDNSDEDVSHDTVCGMYINYCHKDVSYSDFCLILQSMLP